MEWNKVCKGTYIVLIFIEVLFPLYSESLNVSKVEYKNKYEGLQFKLACSPFSFADWVNMFLLWDCVLLLRTCYSSCGRAIWTSITVSAFGFTQLLTIFLPSSVVWVDLFNRVSRESISYYICCINNGVCKCLFVCVLFCSVLFFVIDVLS